MTFDVFRNARLLTGHVIVSVNSTQVPLENVVGHQALGWTQTIGKQLRIQISSRLDDKETSVTLYHEVLEAITLTCQHPPAAAMKYDESDFDRVAYAMHEKFGLATPRNLNRMLQSLGFREE